MTVTLVMIIYWYVTSNTETLAAKMTYIGEIFLISLACQYAYEYAGINGMLAESSLRYARGKTLSKFVNTRVALCYKILNDILRHPSYYDEHLVDDKSLANLQDRADTLMLIMQADKLDKVISMLKGNNTDPKDLYNILTPIEYDRLSKISDGMKVDILQQYVDGLGRIDEERIRYMLLEGLQPPEKSKFAAYNIKLYERWLASQDDGLIEFLKENYGPNYQETLKKKIRRLELASNVNNKLFMTIL